MDELLFKAAEAARIAGGCQLGVLCVLFLRAGGHGRYAAFFCATLICYLLAAPVLGGEVWPVVRGVVLLGAFAVAYALWILSLALFDDSFQLRWIHALVFAALEAVSAASYALGADSIPELLLPLARLFPQVINLGLVILALISAHRGTRDDLIEERRTFRRIFVMVAGAYILLVLSAEISMKGGAAPRLLDSLNVLGVVFLIYYFSYRMLELKPRSFLDARPAVVSDVERDLSVRIEALMQTERLFIREDLHARVLASLLNEQEYKVRRAINGAMGYRNFYDFLNHYRIEEACAILQDESKKSVPILRIAMDCGYSSLAPFNRAFKSLKGSSPTEFRRRAFNSKP